MKKYYIWGPKYIGGELNGPDLVAAVILYDDGTLEFKGRNPELMVDGATVGVVDLGVEGAETLFHKIVSAEVPASMQLTYKNASRRESRDFNRSHLDA